MSGTTTSTSLPFSTILIVRPPWPQIVCSSLSPGSVPRSRSRITAGMPSRPSDAEGGPDDQRPAGDARLLEAGLEVVERADAVGLLGVGGVAHLDQLVVAHQLARPVDDRDADEEQREAQGAAERDRGRAEAADDVPVVADVEREVRDREQDREDRGERRRTRRPGARRASPSPGRRRSAAGGAPASRGWRSARRGRARRARGRCRRPARCCRESRSRVCPVLLLARARRLRRDPDRERRPGRPCRPATRSGPR